jgi:hypothetical protein
MKKAALALCLLLFFSGVVSAQIYVGKRKGSLKFWVGVNAGKYNKTSIKTETDSSYTYLLRGDVKPEELYFLFDKKGTCYSQKWIFECDTCYHIMLHTLLDKKKFEWKPAGTNQYVSKFSKHLMIKEDLPGQIFTITALKLSKAEYQARYNTAAGK